MKVYIKPGGYAVLFSLTAILSILIDRGVTSVTATKTISAGVHRTQTSQR